MTISKVEAQGSYSFFFVLPCSIAIVGALSEVPVLTLLGVIIIVQIQSWLGFELMRLIVRKRDSLPEESIGLGFALGSLVFVVTDQLLVTTSLRDRWWWFVPLILTISARHKLRTVRHMRVNKARLVHFLEQTSLVCGFALSILALEQFWSVWIALGFLSLGLFIRLTTATVHSRVLLTRAGTILALSATASAAWFSLNERPNNWWIRTADFQFFEALSHSLSHFGSRDQVFATGVPIKYHWLSYAWLGLLDRATVAEHWVVVSRVGPAVVAIALYPLVSAIGRRLGLQSGMLLTCFVCFVLLNDFNFESFSLVFSYIWMLAAILCLIKSQTHQEPRFVVVLMLFAAAAIGAKSSNAIVAVALLLTALQLQREQGRSRFVQAQLAVSMCVLLAVTYLVMFQGSGYATTLGFGISGLVRDMYGDISFLPTRWRVIASIPVLLNLSAIFSLPILVLFLSSRRRVWALSKQRRPLLLASLLALAPTSLILTLLDAPWEQERFFLSGFAVLVTFLAPVVLQDARDLQRAPRPHKSSAQVSAMLITFAAISVALALSWLIPTNEGRLSAILVRVVFLSSSLLAVVMTALGLAIFRLLDRVSIYRFSYLFVLASLVPAAITNHQDWARERREFRSEILSPAHAVAMLGDRELIAAAELVKASTHEDEIIASNYFCETTSCTPEDYSPRRSNWGRGGQAVLLAVYTDRRFLVTGYGYSWQDVSPPPEVRRRITWSLNPGSIPLARSLESRVRFFLRDESMPCACSALHDARLIGSEGRFKLLELKQTGQ